MIKQIAVIGLGKFGVSIALELAAMGHEVLAIDKSEKNLDLVAGKVTYSLQLNSTDESAINGVGLRNFDVVIVSIGDDLRASIITCMLVKQAGAGYVVAKSADELHSKILLHIGVDKIVFPEADTAVRLAHSLATSNVLDFVKLSDDYSMSEIIVPTAFVGKTLSQINVRAKHGLNVVAMRTLEKIEVSPMPEYEFKPFDVMVVISTIENIRKFENKFLS